jgi:hypothetical protein
MAVLSIGHQYSELPLHLAVRSVFVDGMPHSNTTKHAANVATIKKFETGLGGFGPHPPKQDALLLLTDTILFMSHSPHEENRVPGFIYTSHKTKRKKSNILG